MAKGLKAVKTARQKGVTGLAWVSLVIAVAGGTLAADTFLGNVIEWVLELFPWGWIPPVLLAGAVVATGVDLFLDGVPNHPSIGSALLVPTIATATPGKLGDTVDRWCGDLLGWIGDELTDWMGTDSSTGLAIGCVVVALLLARRVVRKSKATVVA